MESCQNRTRDMVKQQAQQNILPKIIFDFVIKPTD